MTHERDQSETVSRTAVITVVVLGLYASSLYSYILFHSLIEIVTISVAFTLFILTLNTRKYLSNGYLRLLGIGYAFIAIIDLLHTLAYKGMNVFPGYGANLPTQLWIAARYLQAVTLFAAALLVTRKVDYRAIFGGFAAAVSLLVAMVYSGNFPDCFIEGKGLTTFKIGSEYLISALLLVSMYLCYRIRQYFNGTVFFFIISSIACTVLSEISFTAYASVYGFANLVGHFAKLAAFYLIYRAILVTGLRDPFELIFRSMKQAEEAFTKEKEFSRCLLDSMSDGVVACDTDGILTLFNHSAREWHGMDPMKLPPGEWAQYYDLFRPDGITPLPTDEIPLARAFRGESVRDAGMAIKAKDQPVRFILANGSVIRGEAGQNLGAVVIMRDVTEFGHMEQELRNAKKALENRVEERTEELRRTARDLNEAQRIAHLGSWELNLLTNKLSWSDEIYRIFEIDPAEFGASYEAFLKIVHPDDRAAVNAAFTDSVRSRSPYAIEHRLLFSDGRIKHLFEQCETYYAADDRPLRSIGTVQDITERKRAENAVHELNAGLEKHVGERTRELHKSQQALMNIVEDLNLKTEELEQANSRLQELERLKSMFIASMSHELRTPLNSIIGFSSILHDEWLGPVNPEQKENLNTIKRSGKHLLNLINDVIDVSKIETGRIEISFEEFDLYDVLTEAVQYVEKDIRDKGLELRLEIRHHMIRTDKRRLLQCVVNLLSNAVKFTERGEIAVSFAKVDIERGAGRDGAFSPLIEISVKDTGIGIAEKDIVRLYQPFVRLESHLRTTALGTGLGLYLTKKLAVEALRGDIVCTSALGAGSTFVLKIPEQLEEHS